MTVDMAAYMRAYRAQGRDKTRPATGQPRRPQPSDTRAPLDERGLSEAVQAYTTTATAKQRSEYLNGLLRQRFASILGEPDKPQAPRVVTAADVNRAQLKIGYTPPAPGRYKRDQDIRHAEDAALTAAIKALLPDLPDLMKVAEVLSRVPPEVLDPMTPSRRSLSASKALKRLGAQQTKCKHNGSQHIYAIRNKEKWRATRACDVMAAHAMMHGLPHPVRAGRPPLSAQRIAKERGEPTYMREVACSTCGGYVYDTRTRRCVTCTERRKAAAIDREPRASIA
jgi:hypothetical protein